MNVWLRVATGLLGVLLLLVAAGAWFSRELREEPGDARPQLIDSGTRADLPRARGLELRPGRDRELVRDSCTTCHSLAPILRHDGFAAGLWREEVQKMIDSYGAPIDPENAERIVAYLQRHYAGTPKPAAGTADAPGTR